MGNIITSIWEGFKNLWKKIVDSILSALKTAFKALARALLPIADALFDAFTEWYKDATADLRERFPEGKSYTPEEQAEGKEWIAKLRAAGRARCQAMEEELNAALDEGLEALMATKQA